MVSGYDTTFAVTADRACVSKNAKQDHALNR